MQTPYVREHQEDREISAWFLLDLTGSMDFASAAQSKRDLMLSFVAIMAKLLMQRGNRIGALILSPTESAGFKYIPARMGRRHLLHVLHTAQTTGVSKAPHQTDLNQWLARANGLLKRRSCVFVVSDFMGEFNWAQQMSHLGRRHDTVAARLYDPVEMQLPNAGLMTLQDSESSEQLLLDTANPKFRKRYAQLVEEREMQLQTTFSQSGVDALELSTNEDIAAALLRFSELRKRRLWRA
jgi:uncharacterized protein (DUF58 family)